MDKDLADKFAAMTIDQQNLEMKNSTMGLQYIPGAVKISNK